MTAPIIVQQAVSASTERCWLAITDPDEMREWYFAEIREFDPKPGFVAEFTVTADGRDFVHLWEVTEVVTGRQLSHGWHYRGVVGDGSVTWEIAPDPDGALVTLTCRGIETFPADDPMFTREACEDGWRYFVNERLKAYLDG